MHPVVASWTDEVTAVATAVLALGVLGALWEPALRATHGVDAYPLFRSLAERMEKR